VLKIVSDHTASSYITYASGFQSRSTTILALMREARRLGSLVEETMTHGAPGQSSGKRVSAEGAVLLSDPWGSSASRPICLIRTCHT